MNTETKKQKQNWLIWLIDKNDVSHLCPWTHLLQGKHLSTNRNRTLSLSLLEINGPTSQDDVDHAEQGLGTKASPDSQQYEKKEGQSTATSKVCSLFASNLSFLYFFSPFFFQIFIFFNFIFLAIMRKKMLNCFTLFDSITDGTNLFFSLWYSIT